MRASVFQCLKGLDFARIIQRCLTINYLDSYFFFRLPTCINTFFFVLARGEEKVVFERARLTFQMSRVPSIGKDGLEWVVFSYP